MDLVETYRALDSYGQALALAVMDMERTRAERQADEELIRAHDRARQGARRGAARLRRTDSDEMTTDEGLAMAESAPASLTAADLIRGGGERIDADVTAADAVAEEVSVPRSLLTRSSDLPAGLRRRSIGLYDMPVSAGVGEFLADSTRVEDIVIPDDPRTAEADFALRINGNSMEPRYRTGDIVLVQNADTVEEGELGIFVLDGAGYFKKFGGDCLISLNPSYPPIPLKDFDDVSCCGRVVGKLKKK
jgi:SOS-response transcriptional repressor LexA